MTITIETASVDDLGRLVHAEDAAAQACLAFVRLEDALAERGLGTESIAGVRVLSEADVREDVLDVVREHLYERLGARAASIPVAAQADGLPAQPGVLVALRAQVVAPSQPTHEGPLMSAPLTIDLAALRDVSCILLPGDAGYDEACAPWNLAFPMRPAAVAVPHSIDEVVSAVGAAARLGLRVAPQSTGHLASALSGRVDDVLLLRMHALTGVTVDPVARTARVVGGTLWRDVVAAAAPHALTALHGSAGDVAVAGYVLGGGMSYYGRRHGLASGSVRALEVVTATGRLVRATADEDADLFWALRGGGGNFGAVVAIELDLLPIPDVYAGMLLWDLARGPEVLRAWAAWTSHAPESATTSLRFMRFPPLPELPPFLSGRSLVVIDGAILENDETAANLLSPLRALAPEMDTFGRMPAPHLLDVHMDPPFPTPGVSDHAMLDELPEEAISALLAVAGPGVETPLMVAELRHLGGAFGREQDAALPRLFGRYALFTLCAVPHPEMLALGERVTADAADALRPWSNRTAYGNFAEREVEASALYDTAARARLAAVRNLYDPTRLWVAAHAV